MSVPHRNRQTNEVPGGLSVDDAGRRVAAGSPKLRPRIPTAIGHCAWIKRAVLDVIGEPRLNHRVEVAPGVLAEECGALLKEFFAQKRRAAG